MQIQCKLCWIGLKKTLPVGVVDKLSLQKFLETNNVENTSVSFFGSYLELLNSFKKGLLSESELDLIVVADKAYHAKYVAEPVTFVDVVFDRSRLFISPKSVTEMDLIQTIRSSKKKSYTLNPSNPFREYYKEVLGTYNRVTFFDHFNTFKYILNKDLRKELEDCIYQYFIGVITLETFRDSFRNVEMQLKPAQLEKYNEVKDFVFSVRTEVLLSLVSESSQEKVKASLDKYSLDYFDVNYLKAYLRDYGKTKEEKGKKKERVQELKFEDTNSYEAETFNSTEDLI